MSNCSALQTTGLATGAQIIVSLMGPNAAERRSDFASSMKPAERLHGHSLGVWGAYWDTLGTGFWPATSEINTLLASLV